jgi:hypothetical protein
VHKKGVVYEIIFAPISDIHDHQQPIFKIKKGRDGNPFTKNTNQIKASQHMLQKNITIKTPLIK